jgi:hypothetical protein
MDFIAAIKDRDRGAEDVAIARDLSSVIPLCFLSIQPQTERPCGALRAARYPIFFLASFPLVRKWFRKSG